MSSLVGKLLAKTNSAMQPPVPYTGSGNIALPSTQGISDPTGYMRAYASSGTVYSIVSMLARQTAKKDWHLYRCAPQDGRRRYTTGDKGSDQRVEVIKHLAIEVWTKPNPFMTGFQMRELAQTYLDTTGMSYLVVQRQTENGPPVGLWPVRPDRMNPVPSAEKFLAGYVYQGPSGEAIPLQPEDVIQVKYPNPFDPYTGLGPIQAVLVDIDAAKYSAQWNRNFFLNSATPGGVIQVDKRLSDDEWNEFTNRWRESHRGMGAAHRVAVLEQGAVWVPNAHTIRDMDFGNLRNVSRDVIREAFQIHKAILGTTDDVNRANAQTAQEHFESFLIEDRLARWRDTLNCQFLPLFGATGVGVELDYDDPVTSNREADALELKEKAAAAQALVNAGYDPEDVLEAVGLPDMGVVEKATQTPAVPPAWVPLAPPPAAPGSGAPAVTPAAPANAITAAKDASAKVFEQAAENYPPSATAWMHHAHWKGPVSVPLAHVNAEMAWMDPEQHDKVQEDVQSLQGGQKMKPVILVKTPSGDHLLLVDGHHRYLAAQQLGKPLRAFVGVVAEDHGPWESMHDYQTGQAPDTAKAQMRRMAAWNALDPVAAMRWEAQASADKNTCAACTANDGHLYRNREDAYADYPGGGNYVHCEGAKYGNKCRCTVVKRSADNHQPSRTGRA